MSEEEFVAEAGGNPVELIRAAAERIRAANHATISCRSVPGLRAASDAYSAIGAMVALVQRLPQLCDQLALTVRHAQAQGWLEGRPTDAPDAVMELEMASDAISAFAGHLDAAHNHAGRIGGWLCEPPADADAPGGDAS